jgi:hypothetical protein
LEEAETGDIVLFTGLDLASKMIRSVTGSKFDHVGILIKVHDTNEVILFESLSGKGVCKWNWKYLSETGYWSKTV